MSRRATYCAWSDRPRRTPRWRTSTSRSSCRSSDLMALNFPDSPSSGQVFNNWVWDGTKWGAPAGAGYAPIDSPTFTGDPKAPTPATGDNDTSLATTAFVQTALTGAAIGAPNKLLNPFMEVDQANEGTATA